MIKSFHQRSWRGHQHRRTHPTYVHFEVVQRGPDVSEHYAAAAAAAAKVITSTATSATPTPTAATTTTSTSNNNTSTWPPHETDQKKPAVIPVVFPLVFLSTLAWCCCAHGRCLRHGVLYYD